MKQQELNKLLEYKLRRADIDILFGIFHIYMVGMFFAFAIVTDVFIKIYLLSAFFFIVTYHFLISIIYFYSNKRLKMEIFGR